MATGRARKGEIERPGAQATLLISMPPAKAPVRGLGRSSRPGQGVAGLRHIRAPERPGFPTAIGLPHG